MRLQTKPVGLKDDPLEVFEGLVGQHDVCFLLETLADKYQPQTSGQSYIGVSPKRVFSALENQFSIDGVSNKVENPYQALRDQVNFDKSLPKGYVGGLVGYFSHEGIHNIEPTLHFPYKRSFNDFEFGEYEDGLIFRHDEPPQYFFYNQDRSDLYQAKGTKPGELRIKTVGTKKNRAEYSVMIDKARQDIQNGRVFQVVLANEYEYRYSGDLIKLYRELRRINPSPFMFFMKFKDTITMGASPELLVHTSANGKTYLEALAGTIHRGKTDAEDKKLASQLLADEKEVAEHSMLVDLARNDVGRISKIGSVQIDDLMQVKKLSHVQHISSVVSGELEADKNAYDSLAAAFPAGTLSGAPKIEAIKMIAELEAYERGPYGGTIGYIGYNGDSVQAVNIRSVNAVGDKLLLHTGSGVVYDSQADREYEETQEKKAAMDKAMKPFLSGSSS